MVWSLLRIPHTVSFYWTAPFRAQLGAHAQQGILLKSQIQLGADAQQGILLYSSQIQLRAEAQQGILLDNCCSTIHCTVLSKLTLQKPISDFWFQLDFWTMSPLYIVMEAKFLLRQFCFCFTYLYLYPYIYSWPRNVYMQTNDVIIWKKMQKKLVEYLENSAWGTPYVLSLNFVPNLVGKNYVNIYRVQVLKVYCTCGAL